ncbi:MAG: 2-oxoacid:ferredoxin oxidoreductase subunit beta [Bacteroidetes bacterium]|nr:2-oxoacid:ferredoxin oxidoreductase subunit beta [Bacteroidota bacterium]
MTTPTQPPALSKKDYASDQHIRWCPGCGDHVILSVIQGALARMGIKTENTVFVSGIGCSSRLPYYMNTYGFHTIHGRAIAVASGIKLANPDLSVWVITGDGDAMAIGGNHLIHALRRNIDINIVMFNNEIYGLTKGQTSPTSPVGLITHSSPDGAIEPPFIPGQLVIGCGGTFFARVPDTDLKLMESVVIEAANHKGASFVEVLQNCVIYNDNVHALITSKETRDDNQLKVENGKPLVFGKTRNKGIRLNGLKLEKVDLSANGTTENSILHHDATEPDPALHLMLARMHLPLFPVAVGVLRSVSSPTIERTLWEQIDHLHKTKSVNTIGKLLHSGHTWEVE